jgi:pimeloyl-ACP methyl ester carboxylesterase
MATAQEVVKENGFEYFETGGDGEQLVLLHGLMGTLSNFGGILDHFGKDMNVVVPILPLYTLPLKKLNLDGLVDYIISFLEFKGYSKIHVLGNSLGGHLCQILALRRPDLVKSMILTGSSGLFENAMGSTFPKRGDYEFIRKKTEMVFYDPSNATKELVDDLYETVNDLGKCIRIVKTAKSAVRHNLEDKIKDIKTPTLLVWGKEDTVTPAWVGEKFHELLPNSRLELVEKCGHAPMMEKPEEFNIILEDFLKNLD